MGKNHLSNLNTQVQISKIEWVVWFFAKLLLGMQLLLRVHEYQRTLFWVKKKFLTVSNLKLY